MATPPKIPRINMGHIFIILAVVSGLITLLVFRSGGGEKHEAPKVVTKDLVVAQADILQGEVIDASRIKVVAWPEENYPTSEVYKDTSDIIGRAAKMDIYAGQPIFRLNIAGEDVSGGLSLVIPPGMRAVTIGVSEEKGVAGFVKPGNRVDVLAKLEFNLSSSKKETLGNNLLEDDLYVSETILQDSLVLAVSQDMYNKRPGDEASKKTDGGDDSAKKSDGDAKPAEGAKVATSVTLAVTPEQAEKLFLAEQQGVLKLALRNHDDHILSDLLGAFPNDLLSLDTVMNKLLSGGSLPSLPPMGAVPDPGPAGPPPAPMPSRSVQVIEGTTINSVGF